MHGFNSASSGFGNNVDVNHGSVEGPRGGFAAGTTVTGPRGNTFGRGAAVGPDGGVVAGRGGVGADGGYARGFAYASPSARYGNAVAVRRNYSDYGIYGRGWYGDHPGAWFAAGWVARDAWRVATWYSAGAWCGYGSAAPIYYDYGNNVTYQNNQVYVNGQDQGSSSEYYDQAAALATTGGQTQAPSDGDWLPLGVFAFCKEGETTSEATVQIAINKAGIVRGNYTDSSNSSTEPIQGSVDKQTQRLAFTIGDNTRNVVETGLYNLTKDEAPALIHFGSDRTEQRLLVRLKNNSEQQPQQPQP